MQLGQHTLSMDATHPPFELNKSYYDQNTFWGRYRHFLSKTDPRTLFLTKTQLNESLQLLEDYRNGRLKHGVTNRQLWDAQRIKQVVLHPDSGQEINPMFRLAGLVPVSAPLVVGLLIPNVSIRATITLQVLNQSYNAAFNFSNRNATKEIPPQRFLMGYVGAVTSGCSIQIGLKMLVKKATAFTLPTRMLITRFVPLPAACAANLSNMLLVRCNELKEGIEIMDHNGNTIGTSYIAAKMALTNTAITRVALAVPGYLIPPLIMTAIEKKTDFLKRFPRLHLPLQALVCMGSFAITLPLAISIFPQICTTSVSRLEPEIQEAATSDIVYYNKGL